MKTRTSLLCAILLALAAIGLSGCASLNGPRTLSQVRDDADWAMLRFHNRVTYGGFITPEEQQRVTDAYKAYQAAFNEAARAANLNYKIPAPQNVIDLANQLANAFASIP